MKNKLIYELISIVDPEDGLLLVTKASGGDYLFTAIRSLKYGGIVTTCRNLARGNIRKSR